MREWVSSIRHWQENQLPKQSSSSSPVPRGIHACIQHEMFVHIIMTFFTLWHNYEKSVRRGRERERERERKRERDLDLGLNTNEVKS